MAIKVNGLTKMYKARTLNKEMIFEEKVTDINFKVGRKEIMGILGPSGAGKSSIFKIISMAISRSKGNIEVLGHSFDYNQETADSLTQGQIGIVYQQDVMWPELTVD